MASEGGVVIYLKCAVLCCFCTISKIFCTISPFAGFCDAFFLKRVDKLSTNCHLCTFVCPSLEKWPGMEIKIDMHGILKVRKVLYIILLLFSSLAALSQPGYRYLPAVHKRIVDLEVHFRWDKHQLDMGYMGNDSALARFARIIDRIGLEYIDSVVIVSQSSPEGPYEYNVRLSKRRAATMRNYVMSEFPELDGKLHVHPDGESWEQLRWYVECDTALSDEAKQQIYAVIDADVNMATKKWRMNRLPTYKYLLRKYYPRIRNSMFCILYCSREAVEQFALPPIELPDTLSFIDLQQTSVERKKVMVAALKTNLLYDVVTALNFEVEVPLGRRFSIAFEDLFPWWHGGNKWAFQVWQMGVEGRYWFKKGKQPNLLRGHFAGLYLMSAKFDLQYRREFNYQGEYWSTGLTYGYSMPLGKYFNLEFSVSAGYASIAYRHYNPSPGWEELVRDPYKSGRKGYYGPQRLRCRLCFL